MITPAGVALERSLARQRSAGRRLFAEAACLGIGLAYLAFADPHDRHTPMPICPTKLLTGLDCPACGGLRLVHDLLRGNLHDAVRDNLLLLVCSPLIGYLLWVHARAVRAGRRVSVPPWLRIAVAIVAAGWMVLRNLPGWPMKPTTYG